jgi:streptogramin lyase
VAIQAGFVRRAFVSACLVATLVLLAARPAVAAPAGAVSEFSAGLSACTVPEAIASGPDGNVWFIDGAFPAAFGRVTLGGGITQLPSLSVEHDLEDLVAGADGNMWFTDETGSGGAVGFLTLSGAISEFPVAAGAASAITLGPDGNYWFTVPGTTKAIGRITPAGTVTTYNEGLKPGSEPSDITRGPDGNLWFTDRGTTKTIGKITPAGVITEFPGLPAGSFPSSIAAGPDGNVWFTDVGTTKAIGKITPAGVITEYFAGLLPGSEPVDIAPGADGNVWFTDQGTTRAIGRITASGAIQEYSEGVNQETRPLDLAPGADGSMWFTEWTKPQAVGRAGTGAPPALASPLLVGGGGTAGTAQTCTGSWSTWAGQQPSTTLFGFDGVRWLLDGAPLASGATYTPTAGNVGHQLSCAETVTYPLLNVTTSTVSAPVTVLAAPRTGGPLGPPLSVLRPAMTSVRQSHSRWREGNKLAHITRRRPPVGTTFSFVLNKSATVTFAFRQQTAGRKAGHECVAQTKANRHKHLCKRAVTRGTLAFIAHAGTNKVAFQGRISHGKKLPLGTYTLVITAVSGGLSSSPQRLTFTIVR